MGPVQVPWKEIELIAGQGQDAAVSFSSRRRGEAKAAESDVRKRRAERLEEARSCITQLCDASSVDLPAKSCALVTGCVVDAEGCFALDLLSLSGEEGGLAEALSQRLPLLAARYMASELRQAVPLALERLQMSVDDASLKVAVHSQVLSRAVDMNEDRQKTTSVDKARATIASEILACSSAVCSCFENQQATGGTVHSLKSGQAEAKKALDAISASLAQVLKQQEGAEKDKATADEQVKDLSKRLDKMSSELIPLSGDVAEEERRAADEAMDCLKGAANAAAEHLERMQRLVQALQTSKSVCSQVLQGEVQAARGAAASVAQAQALHGARLKVRDDTQLVLDQQRPAEERLCAILNQAQINMDEANDHYEFVKESLVRADKGWKELQNVVQGRLCEREAEHASRLRSGDLSGLEEDGLRTLLAGRGLGAVFDQIKSKLHSDSVDGALLANVMKRKKPFAEKLEEVFEATLGVKDLCARKRAVHVIELAQLGMDTGQYSEGGSEGTCCCWSETQVRQELRGRGVDVTGAQLAGVNGEVLLLLLRDGDLEQLGADNASFKLRVMQAVEEIREDDVLGRIRLGLEEPPVPG
eukprot:CAMPEP_0206218500 /NCGR_PEP_ID=MMETSP0047_2-20121206/3830_1 /ASSEMBLY_ACC=CAM_ASM_000192 /TAXON_ID=195065 /ORGANISM="Chroomonas mesostigmatica_cf, Strain CCMP1168" /LENGTH=588 /DNA_ID=CAMNT_0053641003 /DNA_START=369 /DNA_END=2131 /DNA_ORIENTATION=-